MMGLEEIELVVVHFLLNKSRQEVTAVARHKLRCETNKIDILLVECWRINKKLRIWRGTLQLNVGKL